MRTSDQRMFNFFEDLSFDIITFQFGFPIVFTILIYDFTTRAFNIQIFKIRCDIGNKLEISINPMILSTLDKKTKFWKSNSRGRNNFATKIIGSRILPPKKSTNIPFFVPSTKKALCRRGTCLVGVVLAWKAWYLPGRRGTCLVGVVPVLAW